MKAKDKFEVLKTRYEVAYFKNNKKSVTTKFENGWIYVISDVLTSTHRVAEFERMTETLERRLISE